MNWGWQEWVVALLVVVCVVRIGYRLRDFFRRVKSGKNPCGDCSCDCELRNLPLQERKDCKERKRKPNKKCCG